MLQHRIVFQEEVLTGQIIQVFINGDVNDAVLESLEVFIKHQRSRLAKNRMDVFLSDIPANKCSIDSEGNVVDNKSKT